MNTLVGDQYQFLQRSAIPTYHFQKSLRRLPVPKLSDSCNRFLKSAKVVLSDSDYGRTQEAVRKFETNEGPVLQSALLEYDRNHKDTSYICEPWFDIYLRSRLPCPVNFNPFMMYAPDPIAKYNHQLSRSTNFAISFARFRRALDKNILAPEVFHLNPKKSDTKLFRNVCRALPPSLSWFGAVMFKAFPLDMSQYKSLFNGTRIPKHDRDILYQDSTQKHFMVLYRGRVYIVDIFDDNGDILPASDIHNSLSHILKNGKQQESDKCVGSLTTLGRDVWASVREEMLEAGNADKLRLIDGAFFTLCLDDLKSDDPIRDTNTHHFVTPDTDPQPANPAMVKEIEFTLTDSLRSRIKSAQRDHIARNSGLSFGTMEYTDMNKDMIKKSKMSPDAIMQLAIQIAFYSLYKQTVPTYESCSTAAFLKGRTECMRSATAATKEATLAILGGGATNVEQLLLNCSTVHGQLVKEASMGQGFDRHMLGLKITANRLGKPNPLLFEDPGFLRMEHFLLSTSTLSTNTIILGGFGPVVEDGFGIGYNVSSSRMGAVISSYKKHRDAKEFGEALLKTLDILRNIIRKLQ
ncbi:unnamed protein product [Angiostrongylus costaricensis]|uniref:Carn_acyltransf domain-containing protein n=1 Tax=Angiostrongylus costaricensis TaxID=334426 RepID=A0A0R3PMJ5_ANGCS|nr:unnamed protein product [Angiostrongylus costaricensis]